MKKKFTKILSVVLAVAMITACFAACSKKNADKDTSANTTIKIGSIGPLTGDNALYGLAVQHGAQLAVDEINAAGGINGVQIEFKMEDDQADTEKSVNAYNSLKDWGMQMLMGTVTSTACIGVAEETYNDKMFMLTPSGTAVDCVKYDNAFRICYSDPNQGSASADYIAEQGLAKKIFAIYDSSNAYSAGIYEKFYSQAQANGLTVESASFTADSNKDFSVQLQQAKTFGAELIFLPIYFSEASLILTQASKLGMDVKFFGCDGLDGILSVQNFDTSLAEGVMLLTPFAAISEDEKTQKFVDDYKKAYNNEVPIQFAADAYDAIYAIKAAAEKAAIKPTMQVDEICEAMKKSMLEIELDGLTGKMTWNADGEPNKEPKGMIIKNGQYVAM
ncbi:MAG: amino acid ABC transporter substrate-binding protein [Escherichia coli]|nr:MAG: amino acid ABC transporter substrate-binding protein [Escherichia coli]